MRRTGSSCNGAVLALVLLSGTLLGGCSSIMSSATADLSRGLTSAVLDQNDPETVREGAPAYLLMIDGLIADRPDSSELLTTGARLYASYTSAFVDEPDRAARLANRAKQYGFAALCSVEPRTCDSWRRPFDEFEALIDRVESRHVEQLYTAGAAWATWVEANRDDWVAVADKARVEAIMKRVVALDPGYGDGAPFTYLGVLNSIIPPALGGRPEEGRRDFERAIELSKGRDLLTKVLFAREYARLVFDRELHDRLLEEVLESDPEVPGLVLTNTLAQDEARILLAESDAYFAE
ncbi:MAG: TRAP transporter TatT component family protein [Holophagae bacterium]